MASQIPSLSELCIRTTLSHNLDVTDYRPLVESVAYGILNNLLAISSEAKTRITAERARENTPSDLEIFQNITTTLLPNIDISHSRESIGYLLEMSQKRGRAIRNAAIIRDWKTSKLCWQAGLSQNKREATR